MQRPDNSSRNGRGSMRHASSTPFYNAVGQKLHEINPLGNCVLILRVITEIPKREMLCFLRCQECFH